MYGQIHVCVRALVLEKFGDEAWKKILEKAGCDDTSDFMVFNRYSDEVTLKLVGAVAETLDVPVATVLEIFGEYFFQYCLQHGYDKMLRTLGDNFESFIQNLDSLHSLLAMTYKSINAPSFRCCTQPDGSVMLHYYTSRVGLYPIVTGLLRSVGKVLFNTKVNCEVLEIDEGANDGHFKQHVAFKVTFVEEEQAEPEQEECIAKSTTEVAPTHVFCPTFPESSIITPRTFCNVFPFHIIFDENLIIKQSGVNVQKLCSVNGRQQRMTDMFNLLQPNMPLTYQHILRFINANFVIELKPKKDNTTTRGLILKGQMIWLEEIRHIIFIGSPRLSSLNELMERKVFLSDIPLYDVTRELVLLNQQRNAEIEVSKKLDETTAELKRTALALEAEKAKTDLLLHQMLPVKVADQLRDGKRVEAEKFEQVTILFSDIVTFTNIAAAVHPMEIVNMLNSLYSLFDAKTEMNQVYKVETIGDAYMVVGGVPDVVENHAEMVANQGLDMVEQSREVPSPASGKPLQIRVGIHTGSVVAGVVGDKMPRYCLFGDTVNTASRMESHGVPGKIHISPTTYQRLMGKGYHLQERGEIDVKGKGKMVTYFLYGSDSKGDLYVGDGEPANGTTDKQKESTAAVSTADKKSENGTSNGVGKQDKSSRPKSGRSSSSKSATCVIA